MSDGWIAMPLSALGFALQLAESRTPAQLEWVDVDPDEPLDLIDLRGEVSVQMFITELVPPLPSHELLF